MCGHVVWTLAGVFEGNCFGNKPSIETDIESIVELIKEKLEKKVAAVLLMKYKTFKELQDENL